MSPRPFARENPTVSASSLLAAVSPVIHKIVVAIKPWERGLPLAATHACQLAKSSNAELRLVSSVFDASVDDGRERGLPAAVATQERTINAARTELERLASSLREWGAKVSTQVVWAAPAYDGILSAVREWHADLLVVGVHERRTLHTRLTDTDWQLIRRVPCPLLLVKDPSFDGYRTIVAAIDPLGAHDEPSGLDRAVLETARCFKRAFGSSLRAVHAFAGADAFALASAVEVAPGTFYGAENVEAVHRRALTELAEEYGIAPSEVDLVVGSPAEVVLDEIAARKAELVVVGAARRSALAMLVIGSTAEAVAAEAPCDVLMVPPPAV